ncbi:MAG: MgtC/SapB family protein [Cellulosilyticaceae bacterium]
MDALMEYLREVNTLSIIIRLTLATIFAGVIGIERGRMKRPAGFRTHILVCIGATMVMITSQYINQELGIGTDPTRMGAQVISGIGFLGAGTIIVVGRNQVKGLTTAAGLWACACMGLAIGIGFYEGAIISCLYLYCVMTAFHKIDRGMQKKSRVMEVYVELENMHALSQFLQQVKESGGTISSLEVEKADELEQEGQKLGSIMTIKLPRQCNHNEYLSILNNVKNVNFIEEIA